MKFFLIPILIISILVAFFEQSKADKNIYVIVIAIVVFMMAMMKLSSKTPSKNIEKKDDDV